MISFSTDMQNEKIAAIALVIIIVGALSVYLVVTYREDILKNLFGEEQEEVIALGDCADVHYTGKFQVNGTVFDTSYESVSQQWGLYDENRTYEPLEIFVDPNMDLQTPEGYENYTSGMITGFINGLIGMKEGEKKTVVIQPEDAYGVWNETMAEMFGMGSQSLDTVLTSSEEINKSTFSEVFPDVEIALNSTFDYGTVLLGMEGILNATITNITDTNVTYKMLPENGTAFLISIFNCNATFIVENNTAFTIHMNLEVNHTFSIYEVYHFKVIDVNETSAKLTMNAGAPDIKLIGQTIVFELEAVNVYKTSQES